MADIHKPSIDGYCVIVKQGFLGYWLLAVCSFHESDPNL